MMGMAGVGRGRKLDRALVVLEALVGAAVIAAVVGRSYGPASTVVFLAGSAIAAATGWFLFKMIAAEARAVEIIRQLKSEDENWRGRAEALIKKRLGFDGGPKPSAARTPVSSTIAAVPDDWAPAVERVFDPRPVAFAVEGARTVCAACGASAESDAAFCTKCGRPKEAA
jgi:hypothetical protein